MFFFFVQPGLTIDLILRGEPPISADELGNLLTEVSKDYRETTGRSLIVAGFAQGSIVAQLADIAAVTAPHLKEAAEIARGVKALRDFCRAVQDAFKRAESGDAPQKRRTKRPGDRVIRAMAETAIKNGHEVEYRHVSADGSITEVRMSLPTATEIRKKGRVRTLQVGNLKREEVDAFHPSTHLTRGADEIAQSLASLSAPSDRAEVEAVIRALVATLKESGMSYLIEGIAQRLDARGHDHLAALVRQAFNEGPNQTVSM